MSGAEAPRLGHPARSGRRLHPRRAVSGRTITSVGFLNHALDLAKPGPLGEGRARRGTGLHAKAALWVDPAMGNTTLSDLTGASVVFYDTMGGGEPGLRRGGPMPDLPQPFRRLRQQHPAVAKAYDALGEACAEAGPLDAKTRELVKLGLAIGARLEGAVHSHTRRSLEAGASPAEIRHVIALAAPTLGFPTTVAVSSWAEDVLGGRKKTR
jgi:alkylhydroperoxidase/carboxymuconolactone decarboxylase family protein YurZ